MNNPKKTIIRTVCGLTAATMLGGGALFAGSPMAQAAIIPGAITSVDVVESNLRQTASGTLRGTWSIPDGAAKPGDTFTLQVDSSVYNLSLLVGRRIPLIDVNTGAQIGEYTVGSDQKTVTFQLNENITGKTNVAGTFSMSITVEKGASVGVTSGEFISDGRSLTDPTPLAVSELPAEDFSNVGTKIAFKNGTDIQAIVAGPRITAAMVGSEYSIKEEVDTTTQTLYCDGQWTTPSLWMSTENNRGLQGSSYFDAHGSINLKKTCDVATGTVTRTFTPNTDMVGLIPSLMSFSKPLPGFTEYKDTGTVTFFGQPYFVMPRSVYVSADGTGWGNTPMVSVGDRVWLDENGNGVQDDGEKGIPGVELSIVGPSGNPVKTADGKDVANVSTDADGLYSFKNLPSLPAGSSYTVRVVTPPADLVPTTAEVGDDRSVDSSTGEASSIVDLSTNGASDMGLDFGFMVAPPETPEPTDPPTTETPEPTDPPTPPVTTPPTTPPVVTPPVVTEPPVKEQPKPNLPPVTAKPPAKPVPMVTRTFQVDNYMPKTKADTLGVSRLDDDGVLKYREDRFMWGKNRWNIVTVRVPQNATDAQVMKAINAKTSSKIGNVNSTRKVAPTTTPRTIVVAWELNARIKPDAKGNYKAWGPRNNWNQRFFARG